MFKLEIKDDTEAETLITENLTCPKAGIIYRVEEFRTPISIQQRWNSDIRPKLAGPKPNVLSVGRATIIKDAQMKRKNRQNVPIVKGHMLHPAKGVQHTKNRQLDSIWWTVKNHMPQFYAKTQLPHNPRIKLSQFRPNNL